MVSSDRDTALALMSLLHRWFATQALPGLGLEHFSMERSEARDYCQLTVAGGVSIRSRAHGSRVALLISAPAQPSEDTIGHSWAGKYLEPSGTVECWEGGWISRAALCATSCLDALR